MTRESLKKSLALVSALLLDDPRTAEEPYIMVEFYRHLYNNIYGLTTKQAIYLLNKEFKY